MPHQQTSPPQSSPHPPSSDTETNSFRHPAALVNTLGHRRFTEFCDACKRYRYIGLCYGTPGVGKTLSARHYANWDKVQAYGNRESQTKPLLKEISKGTAAFYTSPVVSSPGRLEQEIGKSRRLLQNAGIERAQRYEDARTKRLLRRAEQMRDPKRNPEGYRSNEALNMENAFFEQRDRALRVHRGVPDPTALLVIDEADRLRMTGLDQVRNIFDNGGIGLVLIGMPGIEKRLALSTVLFPHWFRS